MYARLITGDLQPDQMDGFLDALGEQWLPALSQARGFKALYLLRGVPGPRIAALVLWESKADALASRFGNLAGGEVMEVVLRA